MITSTSNRTNFDKKIGEDTKTEICVLYTDGMPVKQIAEKLVGQCSDTFIRRYLTDKGLYKPGQGTHKKVAADRISEMRGMGATQKEIAAELGLSIPTVARYLNGKGPRSAAPVTDDALHAELAAASARLALIHGLIVDGSQAGVVDGVLTVDMRDLARWLKAGGATAARELVDKFTR